MTSRPYETLRRAADRMEELAGAEVFPGAESLAGLLRRAQAIQHAVETSDYYNGDAVVLVNFAIEFAHVILREAA